jgi:hypothetical protein
MSYPNEDEGPDEVTWPAEKAEHTPLPWSIRPNKFDDWGFIRGADGQTLACIARGADDKEFDGHRRDGTDPYQANADLIVHSVNAIPNLIAALEPFAKLIDRYDEANIAHNRRRRDDGYIDRPALPDSHRVSVSMGELRAARAALAKVKP